MLKKALGLMITAVALLLWPASPYETTVQAAGIRAASPADTLLEYADDPPCGECVSWSPPASTHWFLGSDGMDCDYGMPGCFQCLDSSCTPELVGPNSCENHHGPCMMTRDDAEALARALEKDDRPTLEALMSEYPQAFRVNSERGVIQIFDCAGFVKAQIHT